MDREALGAGAAQAAAELRAHLGVITAASQVLERSVPGGKERTYLAALNQSVCQMLRLIGRLELGFRLTDEDEIRARNATLDLGPWLRGLSLRLTSVLAAVGVKFRLECPESQLMYGDRQMLQQMLLELVPAAAEGASQVSLTVTAGGQEVSFLVRGNGPVRTAEQLDALTAEQPVGAVSGVALARSIVGFMALYDVYASCDPENAALYLVLSILFKFLKPIFLFISREMERGMPPRKKPAESQEPSKAEEAPDNAEHESETAENMV